MCSHNPNEKPMRLRWEDLEGLNPQQRRQTLLDKTVSSEDDLKRFWKNVKIHGPDECWNWTGLLCKGYGRFRVWVQRKAVRFRAHQLSWYLHTKIHQNGLNVCHTCDNPKCVNPKHLFLGTHLDNQMDKISKERQMRGESSWKAILTENQVLDIRHRCLVLGESQVSVSRFYHVKYATLNSIVLGKNWKHLPMPDDPMNDPMF